MSQITIQKVENSTVYFIYLGGKSTELTIKLCSDSNNNHIEYSTTMSVTDGCVYWMYHPCLLYLDQATIVVSDSNSKFIEEHIVDNLDSQENHFLNLIDDKEDYYKIKQFLNGSYWELFVGDVSGLKDVEERVFKNCKNVIDIGSNLGFFGRYIAQYTKMDNYICVEANEVMNEANRIINKNSAKNHVIDNSVFHERVGEEVDFYFSNNPQAWTCSTVDSDFREKWEGTGNSALSNKTSKITTNLKKLIEDNNLEVVDFLKVDIEGGETCLLDEENMKMLISKVKHISVEYHSDKIRDSFLEAFNKNGFKIESSKEGHFQIVNNNLVPPVLSKKVLLKIGSEALGDCLSATPTIRKVSKSYGHKIFIQTHQPHAFRGSPYIEKIYSYDDSLEQLMFDEVYDTHCHWVRFSNTNDMNSFGDPVELKLGNYEARQIHALGVGIYLYPEEMAYDFYPNAPTDNSKKIDKDFLILHVTENWGSRTWSVEKWQRLVNLIKENTNFKIATVGKSHKEPTFHGAIDKKVIKLENIDHNFCIDSENLKYQGEQKDKGDTLSELWHFINNSFALVSFDSGPIHVAGTTDTNIVCMGSSVRPEKSNPYRNNSQAYKYYYVGGSCDKFCSSDAKYSVKEWGTINSMPYLPNCQEKYDQFYCQPTPEQVFFKICEIKEKEMEN
jgi:FkbM family methyltransferase